jgi:5'-AMP-activated protein kinase catalytic alpha subunit
MVMTNQNRQFILDRILGKRSFSEVYLPRNIRTGENVAIKVICKKKLKSSKPMEDMLKKEISIMRTLNHPNIVQLYQVMATKNNNYLVMEYANGGTVFQKIRSAGENDPS